MCVLKFQASVMSSCGKNLLKSLDPGPLYEFGNITIELSMPIS
jgi:hypothetical protein